MISGIAARILKNRIVFTCLPLAVTLLCIIPLTQLRIETRTADFVPRDHPYMAVHSELERIFGGLNQISLLIKCTQGDILDSTVLERIARCTEELYLLEGINIARINGIAAHKVKKIMPGPNGFRVERLLSTIPANDSEREELRRHIRRNPLVYGRLVSADYTATLIQADFFPEVSSRTIFKNIQNAAAALAAPGLEVYYSGRPILEGWIDSYLPTMAYLFACSAAVLCGLLYISFRSVRAVLLPAFSSLMAAIWGIAAIPLLGLYFNPATILVPFLIFALGISHGVQFMGRYFELAAIHGPSPAASEKVLASLLVPAAASLVTDAVGFFSLMLIPVDLLRAMALSAGIGVIGVFVNTVLFIPSVLSFGAIPRRHRDTEADGKSITGLALAGIARLVAARRAVILGVSVLCISAGICGVTMLRVGDTQPGSPVLHPASHYNVSETVINREFGGNDTFYVLVRGTADEALVSSEVLREMESLQQHMIDRVPAVTGALSLVDYVKGFHRAFNDFNPSFYRIPDLDATIGEYLFLYSITGFPGDFDFLCDRDFKHANIKFDLRDHTASTLNAVMQQAQAWKRDHHRTTRVDVLFPGGTAAMNGAINAMIRQNIPRTLFVVTGAIFIVASLLMRSLTSGVLLLIPLLMSILITFGALGFLHVPITVETLPLISLGMGLGVDYGIYILSRLQNESEPQHAAAIVLSRTGKAVLLAAGCLSLAVLLWVFSPIKLDARLGLCLSFMLFANMLTALTVLPALVLSRASGNKADGVSARP
jgi:hypothetical protein